MTHEYAPAATPDSQEAAVQRHSDAIGTELSHDDILHNEAIRYLGIRARDVGRVYAVDPIRFVTEYTKYKDDVTQLSSADTLRLNELYKDMTPDEQVEAYVSETVNEAILMGKTLESMDALYDDAIDSIDALGKTLKEKESELQVEKDARREDRADAMRRLIQLRLLIEKNFNPTPEQVEQINAIILKEDAEAKQSREVGTITDRFRRIAESIGHIATSGWNHLRPTSSYTADHVTVDSHSAMHIR